MRKVPKLVQDKNIIVYMAIVHIPLTWICYYLVYEY